MAGKRQVGEALARETDHRSGDEDRQRAHEQQHDRPLRHNGSAAFDLGSNVRCGQWLTLLQEASDMGLDDCSGPPQGLFLGPAADDGRAPVWGGGDEALELIGPGNVDGVLSGLGFDIQMRHSC